MRRRAAIPIWAFLTAAALFPAAALAGPPYLTDDPQPTDTGHWEVYDFVDGSRSADGLDGEAGFDINYGSAPDLQLTAVVPLGYSNPRGYSLNGIQAGGGVLEFAAKVKVLHQSDGGWLPDLAVFPRLFFPTSSRFGPARPNLWLPVWAEKDVGPWSVFGGGGYQINPGPEGRNFWQGGMAVTRAFGDKASLGAELWRQGDDSPTGGGFTAVNLGGAWKFARYWSLIGSAGPTWQDHGGRGSDLYVALKLDY